MSPVKPRQRNAEMSAQTKSAIMDAAIACLSSLGYAGTTMADIAQRVGVSRAALLYHFESKNALMAAVVNALYDHMGASYRGVADPALTPAQRVLAVFDIAYQQTHSTEQMALMELLLASRRDVAFRVEVAPIIEQRDHHLEDAWHQLVESLGGPRERLDLLRDFAVSVFRGITICRCLGTNPRSFEQQNELLRTLLIEAL